jgi:uncharacterized Zn-binding protein involved in type VI secretion
MAMRFHIKSACAAILLSVIAGAAPLSAQAPLESGKVPGVITEGAKGVTIGGAPAARAGDRTGDGDAIAKGSSNVFINGRPAVTVGDTTGCGGVVVGGASGVFINGKPVARAGDVTTGCASKK